MLTHNDIKNHLKHDLFRKFGNDEGNAIMDYLIHWWSVKKLTIEGLNELENIKQRILNDVPVQYLTGWTEFAGMELQVNPSVLIPRPETEELVFMMKEKLQSKAPEKWNVLDIGTGSGCIALALKMFFPLWHVTATDVSEAALQTAKSNAAINRLEIEFLQKDILTGHTGQTFDVIVSNPPYVTLKEKPEMQDSVARYEPHMALFVKNDDPLLFYKKIIGLCRDGLLRKGGNLFFEVHFHYGSLLPELMTEFGFNDVQLLKDLSGNNRFIYGVNS